jgi:hypothetical protein
MTESSEGAGDGWVSRQRAMEILGLKSRTAFFDNHAKHLSSRRAGAGRTLCYEEASVIAHAQQREGAKVVAYADVNQWLPAKLAQLMLGMNKHAFYRLASAGRLKRRLRADGGKEYEYAVGEYLNTNTGNDASPPPAKTQENERWLTVAEAKKRGLGARNFTFYVQNGTLRRKENSEQTSYINRYLYALSDLERLATRKTRPYKSRNREKGKGGKNREREAAIARVNAQLELPPAPSIAASRGDTRGAISAFAKLMQADTPHFHSIRITVGDHGKLIVDIDLKKSDRFEIEGGA